MKKLFNKYQEILLYLFFGVGTTIVNYLVYFLCKDIIGIDYKISNILAWFFAVLFAFITNKYFVFQASDTTGQEFLKEMGLFFFYRILSLVIDMGCMILLIEKFGWSDFWAKTLTQIIVIVMNYVLIKRFIFNEKK